MEISEPKSSFNCYTAILTANIILNTTYLPSYNLLKEKLLMLSSLKLNTAFKLLPLLPIIGLYKLLQWILK